MLPELSAPLRMSRRMLPRQQDPTTLSSTEALLLPYRMLGSHLRMGNVLWPREKGQMYGREFREGDETLGNFKRDWRRKESQGKHSVQHWDTRDYEIHRRLWKHSGSTVFCDFPSSKQHYNHFLKPSLSPASANVGSVLFVKEWSLTLLMEAKDDFEELLAPQWQLSLATHLLVFSFCAHFFGWRSLGWGL